MFVGYVYQWKNNIENNGELKVIQILKISILGINRYFKKKLLIKIIRYITKL